MGDALASQRRSAPLRAEPASPSQAKRAAAIARPDEPPKSYGTPPVWYRGWECDYDATAAFWGAEGWRAAKGGWDLDCRQTSGRTWTDLLDEIDAEEEE
jgi:hypothetical protein